MGNTVEKDRNRLTLNRQQEKVGKSKEQSEWITLNKREMWVRKTDEHMRQDWWWTKREKKTKKATVRAAERRQVKERYKEEAVTPIWLIWAHTVAAPWTRANEPHPRPVSTLSFLHLAHTQSNLLHRHSQYREKHPASAIDSKTHEKCVTNTHTGLDVFALPWPPPLLPFINKEALTHKHTVKER